MASPAARYRDRIRRRLEDFYFDGKMELSLRSYIELVMANTPDINLQKLAVFEQQNAIQRAFSPFDPTLNLGFTTKPLHHTAERHSRGRGCPDEPQPKGELHLQPNL